MGVEERVHRLKEPAGKLKPPPACLHGTLPRRAAQSVFRLTPDRRPPYTKVGGAVWDLNPLKQKPAVQKAEKKTEKAERDRGEKL